MEDLEQKQRGLVRCKCLWCDAVFWSERGTAEYDTASCKQKMYRWRKKLEAQKLKAFACVDAITSYLKYDKSTPTACLALQEIRSRIYEALLDSKVVIVK